MALSDSLQAPTNALDARTAEINARELSLQRLLVLTLLRDLSFCCYQGHFSAFGT